MKKISLVLSFLLTIASFSMAQRTVSGVVTDTLGRPLEGANVFVKGTTNGTVTDQNGYYEVYVSGEGAELLFSYLGYESLDVRVRSSDIINVSLKEGVYLETAVVTALGIKRSEKSLSYAVQQLNKEDLNITRQASVAGALAGKVAGIQVLSSPSMQLYSGGVRIRGVGSLSGPGSPIYIVDGTPTFDLPSMDDIESVTVLKGPNATALYGQRGDGGAIVITTKKASQRRGIGIEINQSTFIDRVYLLPSFQNLYAGGAASELIQFQWKEGMPEEWKVFEGKYYHDYTDDTSWGPKMEGQEYIPWYAWYVGTEVFGQTARLVPQPDNVRDFYDTGVTLYNNVNFQTAGQNHEVRVSLTNEDTKGQLPGTLQDKYSLNTVSSFYLGKHLKLGANINYQTVNREGSFSEGSVNSASSNPQLSQWFQRHLDMNMIRKLRNLRSPDGLLGTWNHFNPGSYLQDPQRFYVANFWYNPYASLDFRKLVARDKSLTGNVNLTYAPSEKFQITGFVRRNESNYESESKTYYILETSAIQTGVRNAYSTYLSNGQEDNYEILASFQDRLGPHITVEANAGGNIRINRSKYISGYTSQGLNVPDLFNLSNSKVQTSPYDYRSLKKVRSLYARGSFGYKDMLYLDWSGRNDWSSALPKNKNSYFYPSMGLSFVFSELTGKFLPFLSYGKVRASWAQVGSDLGPYALDLNYNVSANQWNGNFLMYTPNGIIDPGIEPSLSSAYEVGIDLRFLTDRLGLSVTYYSENKINEILSVPITDASGFSFMQINAGRIDRRGLEVQIQAIPVKSRNFNWEFKGNLGTTENEIIELTDDVDRQVGGSDFLATVNEVGGQWGQLRGGGIRRDEEGRPVLAPNGLYLTETDTYFGKILPDFTGGAINTFTYRNLELTFSLDFVKGGNYFSQTMFYGQFAGLLDETAVVNDQGKNVRDPVDEGGGVRVDGVDREGNPLTVYVPAQNYFTQFVFRRISEPFMLDRTYVKMRELSLSYRIPLRRIGLEDYLQGARIALVVRNPWLIYAANRDLDPSESTGYTYENSQLPSSRSFGVNLKLNF